MIIDPSEHYNSEDHWHGRRPYRAVLPDGSVETRFYQGPSLHWDGFGPIAAALVDALGVAPGSSWFDIGCSAGSFIGFLLQRGIDPYGADISAYAVANAAFAVKGRVACADVTSDGFAFDRTYDVCSALDLVEHIYIADQPKLWRAFDRTQARTLALDIGTSHHPDDEWIHSPGQPVPLEREVTAVSGHVTVLTINYWRNYARTWGWLPDEPAMERFEAWRVSQPGYDAMEAWGRRNVLLLRR